MATLSCTLGFCTNGSSEVTQKTHAFEMYFEEALLRFDDVRALKVAYFDNSGVDLLFILYRF